MLMHEKTCVIPITLTRTILFEKTFFFEALLRLQYYITYINSRAIKESNLQSDKTEKQQIKGENVFGIGMCFFNKKL